MLVSRCEQAAATVQIGEVLKMPSVKSSDGPMIAAATSDAHSSCSCYASVRATPDLRPSLDGPQAYMPTSCSVKFLGLCCFAPSVAMILLANGHHTMRPNQ